MVYCGRPSRACRQCKERHVKCDLKDDCRPCRTANLKCSGPRDPSELVFRDESKAVAQKAIRKRQRSNIVPRCVPISIEDRARGFFFEHYVLGKAKVFDYIQTFPPETEPRLRASLSAVSLAHFSIKANSAKVMEMASLSYVSALRLTNEALRNSDLAVKDDTLLSVLLLDLFEKITKRSQDSFESMMKHVNGALALAKIRGIKQFDNPVGLRLFLQLFSVVLIACIQCDVPVPSEILALQVASMDYTNVIEPKVRLSQALVRFIDLRVAIKNSSLRSSDAVLVAKDLDHDFELISKTMPPDFQYSTVAALPSKRVYDDHFHVYPHRRVTHIWNLNRLARILLNEIIVKRCLDVLKHEHPLSVIQEYEAQVKCSESTIASMSTEICASAPQYTFLPRFQASLPFCESGKDPTWARVWKDCNPNGIEIDNPGAASASLSSSQPRPSFWSEIHSPFECARCYSLIYPLYVAAQSFATSAPLRRWVINCLCAMSDEMGIKEASLVAGVLDRGEEIDPWSVYVMIGSYSFSA